MIRLHASRLSRLVACLALWILAGAGCSGEADDAADDTRQPEKTQRPSGTGDAGDTSTEIEPDADDGVVSRLDVASLSPSWSLSGPPDALPNRVELQFERPVAGPDQSKPGSRSKLQVSPPIEGTWTFTSRSTLAFEPKEGFEPGTNYQFRVEALEVERPRPGRGDAGSGANDKDEVPSQLLQPEQTWNVEHATERFKLVSLSEAVPADRRDRVQLEAVFSAPVDHEKLGDYARWRLDSEPVDSVTYESGDADHVVEIYLTDPDLLDLAAKGGVTMRLRGGLPYDDEIRAPASKIEVGLNDGLEIDIKDVVLKEGTEGFYLHVICDDPASGGYDYYWDDESGESYRLHERCQPASNDLEEYVDINPDLDLRASPTEGGFRLLGDFERKTYTLRIQPGLTSTDGGVVAESFQKRFDVPPRSPLVSVPVSGRYIPREMWKHLAIRHRNVDDVEVSVRHVPRDNMVFWMSGEDHDADERTSNLITKETISVEGPLDKTTTSWVDVRRLVDQPRPGVYELNFSAGNQRDTARVLVTDINLVVKRAAPPPDGEWSREVLVWARDVESNEALEGVEMKAIRQSGDALASCTTDASGGCQLVLPDKQLDPSPPFAIVASQGNDVTYLKYDELETEIDSVDRHGEPYRSKQAYRGSLQSERGVYRPGDTAHATGFIRNDSNRAPEAGMPVTLQLRDPRGRLVRDVVRETNAAGMVTFERTFADMAATGQWRLKMSAGGETLATHDFNVEEFVPERMDAEATFEQEDYGFDDRPGVEVEAEYLFGASAEGSRVELNCRVQPTEFEPKHNQDYTYNPLNIQDDYDPVSLKTTRGEIGGGGGTRLECPEIAESSAFPTTGRLLAQVGVREAGSGRVTRASAEARVHPEDFYVGLKSSADEVDPGETYTVDGIVVDWKGRSRSYDDTIQLEFVELQSEWPRYYDSDEGDHRWKQHMRPAIEGTKTVEVDDEGRFEAEFTPGGVEAGYLVRARAGNTETALKFDPGRQHYWSRGPRSTQDRTPRPQAPTSMSVDVPEPIEVGQPHNVTFKAPFAGRVLLTLETHRVRQYQWKKIEAGKNVWTFELEDFAPNVYVGAFLVKDPHLESDSAYLPSRAFGMASARVRPTEHTMPLSVETPKEIRPNRTLEVTVQADGNGQRSGDSPRYVTVAAVDEGILSLTDYETPDPRDALFAKRQLGVDTFDTIGWALSFPPRGQSSSTGGGGGGERPGRVMPVEPVSLWSGVREMPDDGELTVELEVPQYRGELRVMAHAADATRTGMAESKVKVRDPISIQTTTPRFLTANDRAQIPVFLSNTTDQTRTVDVTLEASEKDIAGNVGGADVDETLIELKNAPERTVEIPAGDSKTVVYVVRANRHGGAAEFEVEATSGDLTSRANSTVPFNASGPRERRTQKLEVSSGTMDLTQHLTGWVPTSEQTRLWVTHLEEPKAFDHLERLVRYPYGCIEQTSSSTRPLLHVSTLVRQTDPTLAARGESFDDMIMHGVDRILSMQTPSGGFAYWPGGSDPHPWGSAYATDILMEARDQGYDVPKERIQKALDWMEEYVDSRGTGSGDTWLGTPGLAFMHFVLASADQARKATVRKLVETLPKQPSGVERERAYLLKAALFLAGDRRYESSLKSPYVDTATGDRETGETFYSNRRRRAMVLYVFEELFGHDEAGEALAEQVADDLSANKSSSWYTTQELVWGVTALGKWYRAKSGSIENVELVGNGETVEPSFASEKFGPSWSIVRASEYDQLDLKVERGDSDGTLFLMISSEGVRENPDVEFGGEGLKLTREYRTRDGDEMTPDQHGIGDMAYTRITIKNTTSETVRNVALVDRIPAGWEIENPRLGGGQLPDWVDQEQRWSVDHMNIRDDRVAMFGDLEAGQKATVVYATRATLAGDYQIPPVSAEAMYDPSIWARAPGRPLLIQGPWAEYID